MTLSPVSPSSTKPVGSSLPAVALTGRAQPDFQDPERLARQQRVQKALDENGWRVLSSTDTLRVLDTPLTESTATKIHKRETLSERLIDRAATYIGQDVIDKGKTLTDHAKNVSTQMLAGAAWVNDRTFKKVSSLAITTQQQISYTAGQHLAIQLGVPLFKFLASFSLLAPLVPYLVTTTDFDSVTQTAKLAGWYLFALNVSSSLYVAGIKGFVPFITPPQNKNQYIEKDWETRNWIEKYTEFPELQATILGGSVGISNYFKQTYQKVIPALQNAKNWLQDEETLVLNYLSQLIGKIENKQNKQVEELITHLDALKEAETTDEQLPHVAQIWNSARTYMRYNYAKRPTVAFKKAIKSFLDITASAMPTTEGDLKAIGAEVVQSTLYLSTLAYLQQIAGVNSGSILDKGTLYAGLLGIMTLYGALNSSIITERVAKESQSKAIFIRQGVALIQNMSLAIVTGGILTDSAAFGMQFTVATMTMLGLSYFLKPSAAENTDQSPNAGQQAELAVQTA